MNVVPFAGFRVSLWLHTSIDPPDVEWEVAVARLLKEKRAQNNDLSKFRVLVLSDGGAPNSAQRKRMFVDVFEGAVKTSVITTVLSNPIKRGIGTAISWLNPSLLLVPPTQTREALAHVDLTNVLRGLLVEFHELQSKLPPVKVLSLVEALASQ